MRLAVTGGRDYADRRRVIHAMDAIHELRRIDVVITGMCGRGADRWAEDWAKQKGVQLILYPAPWAKGPEAGPWRNEFMLSDGRPDMLLAFPGGRGTKSCVKAALKLDIELREIE